MRLPYPRAPRRVASILGTVLSLAVAIAVTGPAKALGPAGEDIDRQLATCVDKAMSTMAIVQCHETAIAGWDGLLNQAYREIMALMSDGRGDELRAVQRLWIEYRDANCGFYVHPDGGTLVQIEGAECLYAMTRQRTLELMAIRPY